MSAYTRDITLLLGSDSNQSAVFYGNLDTRTVTRVYGTETAAFVISISASKQLDIYSNYGGTTRCCSVTVVTGQLPVSI